MRILLQPVAEEKSAAAVFVADRGRCAMEISKPAPLVDEIVFSLLEALKCSHHIKARALVCDGNQDTIATEHDLDHDVFCGIASVAVFVGVAESLPHWYQQIPQQARPWHCGEPFR